ncbi:MAG: Rne/Rng family ribonuclease, partial [Deltaproteobacteria bacterium]|nr:Rne/Rng family ribonuclease [Deltaproteobacteria bacterium]
MSAELLMNVTKTETRVALMENRVLAELFYERSRDLGIVGNIYKGKVVKVLPGMDAAFVDIGLEKAAYLYVSDVCQSQESSSMFADQEGELLPFGDDSPDGRIAPDSQIGDLLQEGQDILVRVS